MVLAAVMLMVTTMWRFGFKLQIELEIVIVKCSGLWWVYIEGERLWVEIERCDWLFPVSRGSPAWQGRAV